MRPRYGTETIVLGRTPLSEASALLYLLTPEFGLVKARAQGVRKPGAKLAAALQTLSESDTILVRGKDGWRLSGATLVRNRFVELSPEARLRAGRVARLVLRLVHGETTDPNFFHAFRAFLDALARISDADAEAAECLAALHLLRSLGLDAGGLTEGEEPFAEALLKEVERDRRSYILRVNRGIAASGL